MFKAYIYIDMVYICKFPVGNVGNCKKNNEQKHNHTLMNHLYICIYIYKNMNICEIMREHMSRIKVKDPSFRLAVEPPP